MRLSRGACAIVTGAALLCLSSGTLAAPGFIESSTIERQGDLYELSIVLRCRVRDVEADSRAAADFLRIQFEVTPVCTGAPPSIADSRQQYRAPGSDGTPFDSVEYDGETGRVASLRLNFGSRVKTHVTQGAEDRTIVIRVVDVADTTTGVQLSGREQPTRMQNRSTAPALQYVIHLASSRRRPVTADLPSGDIPDAKSVFVSEVELDGVTWYRVSVGAFASAAEAASTLARLRTRYPGAWIARADGDAKDELIEVQAAVADVPDGGVTADAGESGALMADARQAMIRGELSRAIQIYTKVLQSPGGEHGAEAQELLALARERNGQMAHAKAEYERYLDTYPDTDGAARVRQRLSALLAVAAGPAARDSGSARRAEPDNPWTLRTLVSQYYRRDVNRINDAPESVTQSSLFTDASIDARRRGERFDVALRLTGGYRADLLSESNASGNDVSLSYAFVDIDDAKTSLQARLGRQSRNTGGVLGRFDGLNLAYDLGQRVRLESVAGRPVYSLTNNDPLDRRFYGLSASVTPFGDGFDIGVFGLTQSADGETDRQAVGVEMRYFGERRTLWSMVEYDPSFAELGSAFVQGSWRLPGDLTVTGVLDRRFSPYLTLGNALIGQPDTTFDDLLDTMTRDELRELALARSAPTTTVTLGVSRAMSPKIQLGVNATSSRFEGTDDTGDLAGTPASDFTYVSVDLTASSLLTAGDVSIVSLRQTSTQTSDMLTLSIDTRYPLGRAWRISPRLRVDRRTILSDDSEETAILPSIRLMYRLSRRARFELDAGRRLSSRDMSETDLSLDRDSSYLTVGYQLVF